MDTKGLADSGLVSIVECMAVIKPLIVGSADSLSFEVCASCTAALVDDLQTLVKWFIFSHFAHFLPNALHSDGRFLLKGP